ncbi:pre-mRNA-processing factor 39 [[Candida] jaroonii]|uniref:Pre-mRNA-processing factor 39 n=1 Tax=[Candida] jaroonii TaxID=467808 RepID=A0ACA9Y4X1_9ASCO|nr:pre-mRNA-processing factor 39 [[Candida] jaroonii]
MNSDLPSDIFSDVSVEPSTIEDFKQVKEEVIKTPNDITRWLKLFDNIDSFTNTSNSFTTDFKTFVTTSYNELLSRFPYLVAIWRRFAIVSYKIIGERESIEVLGRSVVNCPYSNDLWRDYITALEVSKDDDLDDYIRRGIKMIGRHFNSDWIWDKYLNIGDKWEKYQNVITIPLYEYSKYYTQYSELSRDMEIEKVVEETYLDTAVKKYGRSLDELSLIEKSQILEEFNYSIFQKTQALVTDQWQWESLIKVPYLDLSLMDTIKSERKIWIEYLNWAINKYQQTQLPRDQVISIFERCLIPNCFDEELWLKYLAFLNLEPDFEQMDLVYNRAINKFVPLDKNVLRFSYPHFLLVHEKHAMINDYIFDLMKYFSGGNHLHKPFKLQFLKCFQSLLQCWNQMYPDFIPYVRSVIDADLTEGGKLGEQVDVMYSNNLMKFVNEDSIQVIIEFYLHHTDDNNTLRSFFNTYYDSSVLKSCSGFWKFFVQLECKNLHFPNLDMIMTYIISHTTLPKIVVDSLVMEYYATATDNYSLFKKLGRNLMEIKLWTSTSVIQNPGLSSRYNLGPQWGKNYDNPGIMIDHKPEIIKRRDFKISEEYVLPSFRNVERAGAQVPYSKK